MRAGFRSLAARQLISETRAHFRLMLKSEKALFTAFLILFIRLMSS